MGAITGTNIEDYILAMSQAGIGVDDIAASLGNIDPALVSQIIKNGGQDTPQNTVYNIQSKNGTTLANAVNYGVNGAKDPAQTGNSNTQQGAAYASTAYVLTGTTATGSSALNLGARIKQFASGVETGQVLTAAGTAGITVVGAAVGAALGKTIDAALYNAAPDFWNNLGLETLNPQTWESNVIENPANPLEKLFNVFMTWDPLAMKTNMYIDKELFDYMAYGLAQSGFFDSAGQPQATDETITYSSQPINYTLIAQGEWYHTGYNSSERYRVLSNTKPVYGFVIMSNSTYAQGAYSGVFAFVSEETFTYRSSSSSTTRTPDRITVGGKTVYIGSRSIGGTTINPTDVGYTFDSQHNNAGSDSALINNNAYIVVYGTHTTPQAMPGVGDQPGATVPPISSTDTQEQVSNKVHGALPNLVNDRIQPTVINPDGTLRDRVAVPVPIPTDAVGTNPLIDVLDVPQQATPALDIPDANAIALEIVAALLANATAESVHENATATDVPVTPNPPDVGTGVTPPVTVPSVSASALWTVYNPSMGEINSLGAWLWSSNFIDQLLKMFSDPMQAIIGVHKVYASPSISGRSNIKVGYLDSGVAANVVGSQYTTINCGTVKLREYFGNVFDYSPHTKVSLFLPFIGVVDLDVGEVMRSDISVVYHVDIFSGACLAEVRVIRDGGSGGVLYTYSGDAAVRYPLSSGSYMGIVSGVLSVVGGVAGTIASGGSLAPALLGGAAGVGGAHTSVQHSGSISGNAGAMGGKKPYLIIRRPQTALAENFEHYSGAGANEKVTVSSMTGYFKLEDVRNVSIKGATDTEIKEIISALEEGVLM